MYIRTLYLFFAVRKQVEQVIHEISALGVDTSGTEDKGSLLVDPVLGLSDLVTVDIELDLGEVIKGKDDLDHYFFISL